MKSSRQGRGGEGVFEARIAVDTGGTFTDVVLVDEGGRPWVSKIPSTPEDPGAAVRDGATRALSSAGLSRARRLVHGTTVATNTLLERRGARTALVTTSGFEDVLTLGRQARPTLYDLDVERPPPLVTPELTFGLRERLDASGAVLRAPGQAERRRLRAWLSEVAPEAVAVCLLHSYAGAAHERWVGEILSGLGLPHSLSVDVHRELREYERAATTTVNAYVLPRMDGYLSRLDRFEKVEDLRVMASRGGTIRVDEARRRPVHTLLSGPAGGVVGAFRAAVRAGFDRIVSFDMGGTSTDVALCEGGIAPAAGGRLVGGVPVAVSMLDVSTVGAGGGSVARVDPGGALRVGPESAGARPGPICYGRGGRAVTVTDAHLALGRVVPEAFLGGAMTLDVEPVAAAMRRLAADAGLSVEATAEGVIAVASSEMERAIRVMSVERGVDPAELTLAAFGGAGPLHAAALVRSLGFARGLRRRRTASRRGAGPVPRVRSRPGAAAPGPAVGDRDARGGRVGRGVADGAPPRRSCGRRARGGLRGAHARGDGAARRAA